MKQFFTFLLLLICISLYSQSDTLHTLYTPYTQHTDPVQKHHGMTESDRWEGITLKANVYSVMHVYKEDLIRPYVGFETGYTILSQTLTINAGAFVCPNDSKYLINGGIGIKLFKPQFVNSNFLK